MSSKSKKSDGTLCTANVDKYYSASNPRPRGVGAISFEGSVSRTHQSFKKETDVNHIVSRAQMAGFLPPPVRPPVFADVSGVRDFKSAVYRVQAVHELFDALPSEVRKRFKNDPLGFLQFCDNPANLSEMAKLGLLSSEDSLPSEPVSGAAKRPKAAEAAPETEAPTGPPKEGKA